MSDDRFFLNLFALMHFNFDSVLDILINQWLRAEAKQLKEAELSYNGLLH